MNVNKTRRKRKRRPTLTPRFGPASPALEIGLIRMAIASQKEESDIRPN
jgi:hypothetical protein